MKTQDELFDFIHALSPNERGYFRKYAALRAGKDSNNLLMFGMLEKAKEYDEEKIKQHYFKSSGKENQAQYNYRRHYLYQLILQSLHEQHAEVSAGMHLQIQLNEAALLFSKAQYRACDKLVRKAFETAERLENFAVLIQLFQWRQKLMPVLGFADVDDKLLTEISIQEQTALKNHAAVLELSNRVNVLIFYHCQVGIALSRKKNKLLKNNEDLLLRGHLRHLAKSNSVRVRIQYYHLLATISFMKLDSAAALKYLQPGMDILLQNTAVYEGEEQRLLSWLCNLLTVCTDYGDWVMFNKYLDEMKRFAALPAVQKNYRVSKDSAFFILLYKLYAAISLENPGQAQQIAAETEKMLARFGQQTDPLNLVQLFVHLAALLVMDLSYAEAYRWIQKLKRLTSGDIRRDIRATARFLEMIIHYETGDMSLVESICRSAERQFKALDRQSEADKLLLSFFKNKLPKTSGKKALKLSLVELCAQLEKLHAQGEPAVDYIEKAIHFWRRKYQG